MTNPVRADSSASPTLAAAVRYAGLGIAVFPLRPKMKMPYGRTNGLKMASADPALATERWSGRAYLPLKPIEELRKANAGKPDAWLLRPVTAGPSANVAIATGAPAGFWVLDLDGPNAATWLAELERQHGALPETVEQLTARGRHLCFAWTADCEGARELRNRSGLGGAPVDVRGQEGYILAPPSVHPGDEAKGVPPGHVYRWREGCAPWERAFAIAPQWLMDLVLPPVAAAPVRPVMRTRENGRASRYGEAALDRACATISGARVGSRDSTLYRTACGIGCLVGGGEIDEAYARDALASAGRVHVPDAMSEAQLARQIERALIWGEARPFTPGDRPKRDRADGSRPTMLQPRREISGDANDARTIWAESECANVGMVRTWLKLRGLAHAGDWPQVAFSGLRAHPAAPVNRHGDRMPALIAPLAVRRTDWATIEGPPALAVLPLVGGAEGIGADRFCWFIGDPAGKAIWLAPAGVDRQLLVALDLQDAWSLGEAAFDSDDRMGVVVVPTLSAFCGAPKGDAYGRVNLDLPEADPAKAPWTEPGMDAVYLAVRGDLRPPEVRVRKFEGGTNRIQLSGEEAARFCGALAEQAWRRKQADGGPGANAVRLLRPSVGDGFHSVAGRSA